MDEEDDFFMVKRKPSAKPRPKPKTSRVKSSQSPAKTKRKSEETSSDIDAGPSRPPKLKAKVDSFALTSSSDDDLIIVTPAKAKGKQKAVARPLTPPPEPDAAILANIDRIVRENLHAQEGRGEYATMEVEDEEDDSLIDMDPALAAIRAEAALKRKDTSFGDSQTGSIVKLEIRMVVNPDIIRTPANERGLAVYERPHEVEVGDNDTFENVFQIIAANTGIGSADQLVLTYRDRRIFRYSTPSSLGMYRQAALRGYKNRDYAAVQAHKKRQEEAKDDDIEIVDGNDDDPPTSPTVAERQLTLKGAGGRRLSVSIEPNATFRQVLRQYLEEFKQLDKMSKAKIEFDGDKIDLASTVGSLEDFEDGDAFDVIVQ